ncbi:MAG TPA: hypothetical protein PKJ45_08415 [Rubrivivax sp.]|nr:hypothetical protein [Rubrivivax sp.]
MTDKPDTTRLRALARERLALRPDVLRAFEAELDRPGMGRALGDGAARQAAELALTGQRLAALLGSPHARDGELLGVVDAFAGRAPSAEPLQPLPAGPAPAGPLPQRQPLMETNRQRVLAALRAAGFDPAALPRLRDGATCPAKTAARAGAGLSGGAFDHAWRELLRSGVVAREP